MGWDGGGKERTDGRTTRKHTNLPEALSTLPRRPDHPRVRVDEKKKYNKRSKTSEIMQPLHKQTQKKTIHKKNQRTELVHASYLTNASGEDEG